MNTQTNQFYIKASWYWIVGFTLFRLFYSPTFNLVPDEAYYWQWSRYLSIGYHDHGPMTAWLIRLCTILLDHTEFSVRLPAVLSATITSVYMAKMACRWATPLTMFNTVILSQALLLFNVGGLIITPDCFQIAAWSGACYHVARAYEDGSPGQWLIGGIWFGLGMLCKFTMALFLPCAFFFGLCSKQHQKKLASPYPYIGVALGLLLFTPVILWNADNNWASFRHVAYQSGANQDAFFNFRYLFDYIGTQVGVISPLVFILVVIYGYMCCKKAYRETNWIYSYLVFTSFPLLIGFMALSVHTNVEGNWPAPAYVTLCLLLAARFGDRSNAARNNKLIRFSQMLWPWAVGSSYVISALLLMHVAYPFLPIPLKSDRIIQEVYGWKTIGEEVGKLNDGKFDGETDFIFGIRYQIASELAFYTPGRPHTVSINKWRRPNMYDIWWEDSSLIGKNAIGVTKDPDSHLTKLNQVFDRVDAPITLNVYRKSAFTDVNISDTPVKTVYLYRAYGFKGGVKWHPEDRLDIRSVGQVKQKTSPSPGVDYKSKEYAF